MVLLPSCSCCTCPLGECQITIEFLDENSCEDDVFDLYLKNPTTSVERFIQTVDLKSDPPGGCVTPGRTYADIRIPVTVTPADFDSDCKVIIGLRYVSPNCCNTFARFRIRRPNGCLLYGAYFGQGGLETIYTWLELCNDDPCPPPPPKPCCSKIKQCENTIVVRKCGAYSYQECCSSNADNNEDAATYCSGEDPPVTTCEIGSLPAAHAPYDCLDGGFGSGAWVTVSGWSAYTGDTSGLSDDDISLIAEVEAKVNQSFHVPLDCLGSKQVTFDLGAGASRDTRDCSSAHWFATITVNLCSRTASVAVGNVACFDATDIQIDLGALTAIAVPCNTWTGCICEGYDQTIPILTPGGSGGGSVTVSSS